MGSREKIIGRINKIRLKKEFDSKEEPDWNEDVLASIDDPLDELFKKELENVNGNCSLVENEKEITKELESFCTKHQLNNVACLNEELLSLVPDGVEVVAVNQADASITNCEYLIARTGSAVVSSMVAKSRQIQIYPPVHIVVAKASQLLPFLTDAIENLEQKYKGDFPSQISLITGPSRTADIEKTLVLGAHGPKKLLVFIIKNN